MITSTDKLLIIIVQRSINQFIAANNCMVFMYQVCIFDRSPWLTIWIWWSSWQSIGLFMLSSIPEADIILKEWSARAQCVSITWGVYAFICGGKHFLLLFLALSPFAWLSIKVTLMAAVLGHFPPTAWQFHCPHSLDPLPTLAIAIPVQ